MNKLQHHLLITLAALASASCSHYEEVRLSTFDAAMALATSTSWPAFFDVSQVPRDLPIATPFAQVIGDFPNDYDIVDQRWRIGDQCVVRGLRPDFIVFEPHGLTSDGNVTQGAPTLSGGGIGVAFTNTPMIRKQAVAICYRLAPVALGVTLDANWMVTHVENSAQPSGIKEGDSVQAIDNAEVRPRTPQDVAPWLGVALRRKPTDEVEIEWIRPGTGRMRGKLALAAPQPMPADAPPMPQYVRR